MDFIGDTYEIGDVLKVCIMVLTLVLLHGLEEFFFSSF